MATAPVAPPLCNYFTVNDQSPGSQVWDLAAGAFVALSDATFNSWLSQLAAIPNGSPYFPYNLQILSAASSDAGTTTTFAVNDTSIMTTGAKYNISATGLYDGNFALTVVDATHLKTSQAFAGNATGQISGAAIVDTFANLMSNIDKQNQTIVPPSYFAVSSSAGYQMANTPPLLFDFTPTLGSLSVTLPQMNVPDSLAKGRPLIIHNAGSFPFSLKNNSGSSFALFPTVPIGMFVHLYLNDNTTGNGSFDVEQVTRTVAVGPGDADATISIVGNPITTVVTTVLTAPRTWTLGAANSGINGNLILLIDQTGVVTSTNTITVPTNGSDRLNGNPAGSVVLNRAFDWVLLETNGNNRYAIVGGKGALASTDLSDLPIPVASGGTGNTTGQPSGMAGGDLSGTYPNPTVAKVNGNNPIHVADGGTGDATLTAHAVLLGEGTSAIAFATIGTAGRALIDQGAGADPAFEAISGDGTLAGTGALTVTKTSGVAFAASATTDTTNAANISSGTLAVGRGGTGQTTGSYVGNQAWTPSDQSGAGLTFSGVNVEYDRAANMVFVMGRLTFPVTLSATPVVIGGLPVVVPNRLSAQNFFLAVTTAGFAFPVAVATVANSSTFTLSNADSLVNITNAQMSGATLAFSLSYPAS